jgi:S-DNA-T family DNA segregation ATPase FtsK/SpoIIIE
MVYRGDEPAPLLPSSIQDAINGWLRTVLGYLVLLACAAGGACLLTWSAADPSLTHATGAAARNALGPIGAILADLVMQLLGLAGVFVLLPPSFWALQLVSAQRLGRMRTQLLLAPAAILLLAGAAAALPSAPAWPLHHGYGGMLGDLGLGVMASLLAHLEGDRSTATAGGLYFALGMAVLFASLGLSRRDLMLICRPARGLPRGAAARLWRALRRRAVAITAPGDGQRREPMFAAAAPIDSERREPSFTAGYAARNPAPEVAPAPAVNDRVVAEPRSPLPAGGRDPSFDSLTDRASRAIAERFAPARRRSVTPQRRDRTPAPAIDQALLRVPARGAGDVTGRHDLGAAPEATSGRRPPLGLLKRPPTAKPDDGYSEAALRDHGRQIEACLSERGATGSITEIHSGPVVTLFAFQPARGAKVERIVALADDVARTLRVPSVRVAPFPGRNALGIEVPSERRQRIALRELFECDDFRASNACLPLALGRDATGAPVVADLARMPHLLVGGMAGSGMSAGIAAMVLSLLYRLSPEQLRLLMIDGRTGMLTRFADIPHLLCPVVGDAEAAGAALRWAVAEVDRRLRTLARASVRSIDLFNIGVARRPRRGVPADACGGVDGGTMPHIVIVIDTFTARMAEAGTAIAGPLQRLAPAARAAGVHLIVATESATPGAATLKPGFAARICFKVASRRDSRSILDAEGGERLLGEGDMLFRNVSGRVVRVHAPDVAAAELEGVAAFLRQHGAPQYVAGIAPCRDGRSREKAGEKGAAAPWQTVPPSLAHHGYA